MDTSTILAILISIIVVGNVLMPSNSQNFIISVEKDDLDAINSKKDDYSPKEANELQGTDGDSLIHSAFKNENVTINNSSKVSFIIVLKSIKFF